MVRDERPLVPLSPCPPIGRSELLLLAAIVGLALALRLFNLDGQPLGLWRDESRHGLQALRIWQDPSYRPIYVVEGADLPALIFYLMAPVVAMFGPEAWSARLVSALAGGLTPLALWWAARPLIGARGALAAAALIAWASWSLSLSRWAFPATLDHLLMLTAVGLMWRGLRIADLSRNLQSAICNLQLAGAGLCAGLAAYAYHTGRLAPLILAVLTVIRLGPRWQAWRRAAPALASAAIVGLLVLSPLLRYIADDWAGYNRRVGAVSVFNSVDLDAHAPLALLLRNAERYTLMWHVQGEPNGRHHAPLAPMLDPITGALLLLGLGLALAQWRRPERLALLAWLPLAIVPGLLSSEAPHAMRSLGGLAPACILAGLALADLSQKVKGKRQNAGQPPSFYLLPFAFCLVISLGFNSWLYFGSMARDPLVYGEFDVAQTMMARAAQAPLESADPAVRATRVYLTSGAQKEDTVRFLTDGLALNTLAGPIGPLERGESALIVLPADSPPEAVAAALRDLGPGAQEIAAGPRYPTGAPVLRALGIGEGAARIMAGLQ
jgi:4-amino-4-deoxy-L-arabinose transferase-like glycosyltransferase